jgi:hypothetical protein
MSHILDKSKTHPQMKALLDDLQEVLRKHKALLSGNFAVHLADSEEGEREHRRPDGKSLYHLSFIEPDEIERWH